MINKALKIFFPLLSMCLTCSCSNTGANQGGNMNKQPELYEEVYEIADLLRSESYTFADIGKKYNVSEATIGGINSGILWNYLNLDLNF